MIDDYVRWLKAQDNIPPRTGYMIQRFEKISESIAAQIALDKEKMWKGAEIRTK